MWIFPVAYGESNQIITPLGADAIKTTSTAGVARLFDTQFQTVRKKAKSIE